MKAYGMKLLLIDTVILIKMGILMNKMTILMSIIVITNQWEVLEHGVLPQDLVVDKEQVISIV